MGKGELGGSWGGNKHNQWEVGLVICLVERGRWERAGVSVDDD